MKIAIIYATKGGTTRTCAELLAKELKNHEVTLLDLAEGEPSLTHFDCLVLGFPIRMGKAYRPARKYLKKNQDVLLAHRTAYFLCCGFIDCFEDYAAHCIPEVLREGAEAVVCLGGSLDPAKVKGLDRMVVKMVRNHILGGGDNADQRRDMALPTVMENNIAQLADKIKSI